jgi:NNP family nitrate/nitrite transporter-like MFS transporter
MTGIVGAAGGVGGFFLPNLLGGLKGLTGTFGSGFAVFALTGAGCIALLLVLRARWEATFLARPERAETIVPTEDALTPAPASAN